VTTSDATALETARALLRRRLAESGRAPVPSTPATNLLQIGGLASTVEQRLCDETLALLLDDGGERISSLLVVDLSIIGRAATVWLGRVLPLLAERLESPQITLALPATRRAGRGRLLARHLETVSAEAGVEVELLSGPAPLERSAPEAAELELLDRGFDRILALSLSGTAGIRAPWPSHPGRRWLELAHGAVFSFVTPTATLADLPHLCALWPKRRQPPQILVEALDAQGARLEERIDLTDADRASHDLACLLNQERADPWRLVVAPAEGSNGTSLACPNDAACLSMTLPLSPRRTLEAGRLRLVAAHRERLVEPT
jgi:hypothetical protein